MRNLQYAVEDQIANVSFGRPHVVILGAGASRAALPNGDRNGRRLPVMADIVSVLGLEAVLKGAGLDPSGNFEENYASLSTSLSEGQALAAINRRVEEYFGSLELPDEATIYDALVLSLRKKDLIATFNWDPFLYQAMYRNHRVADMPHVVYLHGSVAIGYCLEDRTKGHRGGRCSACHRPYASSRLLYPITQKGYSDDPFISVEWSTLQRQMKQAFMLTVFGYGAPASDVEAIDLLKDGWGTVDERNMEQTEVIDIRPEDALRDLWSPFIHTHHFDIFRTFYDSWVARFPRRTGEIYWQQFYEANFVADNRVPQPTALAELQTWYRPLLEAESRRQQ
jgi:hypothetical protein